MSTRRFIPALVGAVLVSPAMAADLYPAKAPTPAAAAPMSWAGLYLEGYGLYGVNFTDVAVAGGATFADVASSPHGPGLGGAIGYRFNLGYFVAGVRADLAYANMSGSGQINSAALSVSNATNYLGDVDAVFGVPISSDGRLLAYGVAGFAWGGAKPNLSVGTLSAAASDTSTGWNVGAGLSYALDQHWSIGIEGDYFRLGDKSLTASDPITGAVLATSTAHYRIFEQKFGVNYRF